MPVQRCTEDGKPGYKWGKKGKCFTYTAGDEASRERAKNKAKAVGRAIWARRSGGEISEQAQHQIEDQLDAADEHKV